LFVSVDLGYTLFRNGEQQAGSRGQRQVDHAGRNREIGDGGGGGVVVEVLLLPVIGCDIDMNHRHHPTPPASPLSSSGMRVDSRIWPNLRLFPALFPDVSYE
jgi:hypothetical protein